MMKNQVWAMLIALNLLGVVVGSPIFHHLEPRQSSDGCGPNPLVAVMFYAREFADFSPQQLLRLIETDTRAGSQLRSLLRTYDDCVRTGDGTRYKKSGNEIPEVSQKPPAPSLMDVNQSFLQALGRSSSSQ